MKQYHLSKNKFLEIKPLLEQHFGEENTKWWYDVTLVMFDTNRMPIFLLTVDVPEEEEKQSLFWLELML